jgi:hypothetical protein
MFNIHPSRQNLYCLPQAGKEISRSLDFWSSKGTRCRQEN